MNTATVYHFGMTTVRAVGFGSCEECARLLAEHERLKDIRRVAADMLRIASAGSFPAREYRRLRVTANEAWLDAECASLELDHHRRRHSKVT